MSEKFRLKNKKLHLTYSDHLEPINLIGWLNNVSKIKYYSVAKETGETGHKHTHCLVEFENVLITTNSRIFDYQTLHPNIKKVKTVEHWNYTITYHTKEDKPYTNINPAPVKTKELPKITETKFKCKGCSKKKCENNEACQECQDKYEDTRDMGVDELWNKYSSVSEAIQGRCKRSIKGLSSIKMAMALKPVDYGPEPTVDWLIWQAKIKKEISVECTDDRTIIWIAREEGNIGKTGFSKHMLMWHDVFLATHVNAYHIGTQIQNRYREGRPIKTIMINLAKTQIDNQNIYAGLEMLKDGLITSQKFNGETIVFNPPHVIVFANFFPNQHCLSQDRWDIRTIDEATEDFVYMVKPERKIIKPLKPGFSKPGVIKFVAEPDEILSGDETNSDDEEEETVISSVSSPIRRRKDFAKSKRFTDRRERLASRVKK